MRKLAIILLIVAATVGAAKLAGLPKAKVTLRALDEQGKPIAGAEARCSFESAKPMFGGGGGMIEKGLTDEKGEFSAEGHSFDTKGGHVSKEGYYTGSAKPFKFKKSRLGKWEPWNPILDVVLKQIINPIPMYARKVGYDSVRRVEIPAVGGPYGFDLIESDWVAPHGKGKIGDFCLSLERRFVDWRDYDATVRVTFSHPGDGIRPIEVPSQEKLTSISRLKLPREATADGYLSELKTRIGRTPTGSGYQDSREERSYFYRVRTVLDENGALVSALYGKIDGDILIHAIDSKTCIVQFTYYLNPSPNDRNLEFDTARNLLTGLDPMEEVKDP